MEGISVTVTFDYGEELKRVINNIAVRGDLGASECVWIYNSIYRLLSNLAIATEDLTAESFTDLSNLLASTASVIAEDFH